MRKLILVSVLVIGGSLAACQTAQQPAPLPENLTIQSDTSGLSESQAAFLGRWHGRWGGTLDGYLVVTQITPPNADVIYAWGTNRHVSEAGWVERTAEFEGDKLVVPVNKERNIKAVYEMKANGNLKGVYTRPGNVRSEATLVCETC